MTSSKKSSPKSAKPSTKVGRRLFLRGAGTVALGLPFLESFGRTSRAKAAPADYSFAVWCRQANGVAQADLQWDPARAEPDLFWPTATGRLTRESLAAMSTQAMSELADFADVLLPVAGLRFPFPGNGCGHSGGGNQVLTAARVSDTPSGNESLAMGESVDNRLARELPSSTTDPLTLFTGRKSGYLPEVLSYRGPRDLRAAENDPYLVYSRMVGMSGRSDEELNAARLRQASVNDVVRDQMSWLLSRDLSGADRRRLDLHFSAIRDLEITMGCNLPAMREMELDGVDPLSEGNYQLVTQMHMDVIAIALTCGYTRSATLQMGNGNDGTQHSISGVNGGAALPRYHQISHRIYSDGSEGDPIAGAHGLHHQVDRMHARLFKYLLERLAERDTPDGDRLLDVGTACWTNDLGAGVSHTYNNVPFIFAGSLGGNLAVGQYVDVREGNTYQAHNRVFNTILSAAGVRKSDGSLVDDFGDSSLPRGLLDAMVDPSGPAWG
jgi:hypothetical protein